MINFKFKKKIFQHQIIKYFLLAIVLHAIIFASISIFFVPLVPKYQKAKNPFLYTRAYLYHEMNKKNQAIAAKSNEQKSLLGLEKSTFDQTNASPLLHEINHQETKSSADNNENKNLQSKNRQNIHLLGEKNIDKPFIKLLGLAIGSHLFYPRIAIDFNLHGVVLVGFVIHPEGFISDARVVRSSGTSVLDDAALIAVQKMPMINTAYLYIKKPTFLISGIIFN